MEISCPISEERINENVVRLIAFMVAIIGVACLGFGNYWAMLFLTIDFATRSFTSGRLSLLRFFALQIFRLVKLPIKVTDLAPKKFAATLGFIFCLTISLFYVLNYPTIAFGLTIILLVFAVLESVFAVCVGCYVYSFLQRFKSEKIV